METTTENQDAQDLGDTKVLQSDSISYADLVVKEVKEGVSEAELALLHSDPLHWKNALTQIKRNVEIQFTNQKAKRLTHRDELLADGYEGADLEDSMTELQATQERWKVNALRFLASVEERICQANEMLQ